MNNQVECLGTNKRFIGFPKEGGGDVFVDLLSVVSFRDGNEGQTVIVFDKGHYEIADVPLSRVLKEFGRATR